MKNITKKSLYKNRFKYDLHGFTLEDANLKVREIIQSCVANKIREILKIVKFAHPYYNQRALDAQPELVNLQNKKDLLFCGSYFGYGFHEDGIKSSIEMLRSLND